MLEQLQGVLTLAEWCKAINYHWLLINETTTFFFSFYLLLLLLFSRSSSFLRFFVFW